MSPRAAYILGLDWTRPDSPNALVRWGSNVVLFASGVLVLVLGAVQLTRAECKRKRGRR